MGTNTEEIRNYAYWVLRYNHPKRMGANEIAHEIQIKYGLKLSRWQVHRALRSFARSNKHFAIFPSFFPQRITYSVYILDEPFTPEIPLKPIKIIELTPIDLFKL